MPVVINPASEYAKEIRKHEQHPTRFALDEDGNMRPGNPYVFRPYPRMLYKAQRQPNGQPACLMPQPDSFAFEKMDQYERAILQVETFNKACQTIVPSEEAERVAQGQGWSLTPQAALERYEQEQQAHAQAAAEAAHAAQRMSEKARAELAAADAATHEHVTDVVKTRGRKRGARAVAQTETE
jgi:hypothetical protein